MGAKVSIQDQVFQMKMSSKKLEKSAQKALKQEAATKKKVRAFVLYPFPARRQFQSVEEQLPQARTRGTLPHAAARYLRSFLFASSEALRPLSLNAVLSMACRG